MSESWKNRLWSLLLVCTFAVVLSVCNKAVNSSSNGSSNSGTAIADESSTIAISSMPNLSVTSSAQVSSLPNLKLDNGTSFAVSSFPSVTIASQAIPSISGMMICGYETQPMYNQGKNITMTVLLLTQLN